MATTRYHDVSRELATLKLELSQRAYNWAVRATIDPESPSELGARIAEANGIRPNRPHAALIRRTLRAAGFDRGIVDRINTGKRTCRVVLNSDHWDDQALTNAIIATLRPLWHDGGSRVRSYTPGFIRISMERWRETWPTGAGSESTTSAAA